MRLNGKEDLRIRKTVTIIRRTFERMIIKMDYEQITEKMLAEEAMMNVKTFYSYYSSLAELVMEFQSEMADEFISIIKKHKIPEELDQINSEFITALSQRGLAYERIMMSTNFGYVNFKTMEKLLNEIYKDDTNYTEAEMFKRKVLINFVNTTSLDVYRKWVDIGKKIPLRDVIDLSSKLIVSGTKDLIKKED
jgi:AcrR family transcriptional regulator